jgi:peptide/nickel transport system permease protein
VLTFVIRRLLLAVPVLLGVVFVVMLTVQLIPGDAVQLMLGEHATKEAVAKLRDYLGLDKPLLVRYVDYVKRLLTGDLGRSIQQNRPVIDELADAWPATLELTVAALVIAAAVGVVAGIVSAAWPNSLFDAVARLGSLFGLSMPVFWTGLVLIVVFALWLPWLPVGGVGSPSHLVLPAVTLALPSVAMVARMTRSSVLEVLREDYVRTARAKGAPESQVLRAHVLRNALLPVVTMLGMDISVALGGAIFTESVYSLPGLGRTLVQSLDSVDLPVMVGIVVFATTCIILINLVVDLLYAVIDPRIRLA